MECCALRGPLPWGGEPEIGRGPPLHTNRSFRRTRQQTLSGACSGVEARPLARASIGAKAETKAAIVRVRRSVKHPGRHCKVAYGGFAVGGDGYGDRRGNPTAVATHRILDSNR